MYASEVWKLLHVDLGGVEDPRVCFSEVYATVVLLTKNKSLYRILSSHLLPLFDLKFLNQVKSQCCSRRNALFTEHNWCWSGGSWLGFHELYCVGCQIN